MPRPMLLFFYSEANYGLGALADAEKGYKLVIELFPGSGESKKAKTRLEEIRNKNFNSD
ncbi:MAG: hypothetical protein HY758_08610 [Nitrospirae bacterium]|nr:hypothetical protein [Nitrospirota bacterium]